MRDVNVKSKQIGTSIIGEEIDVNGRINSEIHVNNEALLNELIAQISKLSSDVLDNREVISSENLEQAVIKINQSMKKAAETEDVESKKEHVSQTLNDVNGLLGSTNDIFSKLFKLTAILGLGSG